MPDCDGEKLVDIVGESHSIRMRQRSRSPGSICDPMHMKKRFVQKNRDAGRFFGRHRNAGLSVGDSISDVDQR